MMKRITAVSLVIILALTLTAMAACGGGGGGKPVNITIGEDAGDDNSGGDAAGGENTAADPGDPGSSGGKSGFDSKGARLVEYIYGPNADSFKGTYHYEYDGQGKLIKITVDADVNQGIWDITYPDDETHHYENTDLGTIFNITLDPDTERWIHFSGNPQGMQMEQDLEYEDDFLTKTTTTGFMKSENYYFWNDGVLDAIEINAMGVTMKTAFTYGEIPNKLTSISPWTTSHQGNWYTFPYLCGNICPNLLTQEKQDLTGVKIDWRYELDADGYVTHVYSKENGGEEVLFYEVEYCSS